MSAPVVSESVTVPALPEQVRVARAFVTGALGETHAQAGLVLLLASELVTNSVRHSGPAVPGGVVTVTVAAGDEVVRVEVTDRCGDGVPVPPSASEPARRGGGERGTAAGGGAVGAVGLPAGRLNGPSAALTGTLDDERPASAR
jgi:anti-sigma regulatory factor (Ser/Thr protein kinase)